MLARAQDFPTQDKRGRRRPDGSEDPSTNPNSANLPGASSKALLEERQKNIKKEVEKTDSTTVLSLAMVKKAEEIEKLAKQIKDHAKG